MKRKINNHPGELGLDDEFPRLKYKGYRVSDVVNSNPDYIRMCCENEWFNFDDEVLEKLETVEQSRL